MIPQEKNLNNFIAKKSLGQNFLHAPHVANTMIRAANIGPDSIVLEVGPGKGALTEKILSTGATIVAVEKDDRAISFLQEKFSDAVKMGKLKIIHRDILDFSLENLNEDGLVCGEYILAANIPYYITGEFLRKFLESSCQPQRMVLMVQKEVAKRITVNTGNKKGQKESILSISVKAYGKPSYITTVPARYFRPVPNVDSAVLLIETISNKFFNNDSTEYNKIKNSGSEENFFSVVKAGFAHKRKVLIKNIENKDLTMGLDRETLQKIWQERGFSVKIRAEELTLDDWRAIVATTTHNRQ